MQPYDKNIMPVENVTVAIAAMGEGFHNYHVNNLSGRHRKVINLFLIFYSTARFPLGLSYRRIWWMEKLSNEYNNSIY
jgi:hypothetical protein